MDRLPSYSSLLSRLRPSAPTSVRSVSAPSARPSLPPLTEEIILPTTRVYLVYDPSSPPPHPGEGWTRFVCISDTHARRFEVPDGDVLLHAGDITNVGLGEEFEDMVEWLAGLPHPVKILIAGNHDLPLHHEWYLENGTRWSAHHDLPETRAALLELLKGQKAQEGRLVYLENESYAFRVGEGRREWTVYGSPWQPYFHNWAFNYHPGDEAEEIVSQISPCDILMTHGPPYQILDLTIRSDSAGCPTLLAHLPRIHPRLHLFGHIHEAHGAEVHSLSSLGGKDGEEGEVLFVNAANMPLGVRATGEDGERISVGGRGFQPVIVDFKDEPDKTL